MPSKQTMSDPGVVYIDGFLALLYTSQHHLQLHPHHHNRPQSPCASLSLPSCSPSCPSWPLALPSAQSLTLVSTPSMMLHSRSR